MSRELTDRRAAQRLPFIVQIDLTWDGGAISSYSTDLSEAGLFFKTDKSIPLGAEVRLEFTLFSRDDRVPVVIVGRVARRRSLEQSIATNGLAGLGVRFTRMESGRQELLDFLGQSLEEIQMPLPPLPEAEIPQPAAGEEGLEVRWGTTPEVENTATLFDLDRHGSFFVETPDPPEVGAHVYLWLSLPLTPQPMPVKETATVTHRTREGAERQGMVVRIELSTLDVRIIETFFMVRRLPPPSEPGPGRRDDEIYRSLGLPPPRLAPEPEETTLPVAHAPVHTPSRPLLFAGGAALFLALIWLVLSAF